MHTEVNKVRLTVLIALLFSTLCAAVFRTPPILFMAALLCSAPIVSFIASRVSGRGLQIERDLPEVGTVGDIISGELTLKNTARLPAFLANVQSGQKTGAIVSVGDGEYVAATLRGNMQTSWKHQWILRRRGIHTLAPATAGVLDPLGLSTRLPKRSESIDITILPRPVKIDQLGMLGGMGANNQTPRHSTAVADAMDFHGVRAWQPGETIRRAHWKSTARTGQLHVVEWEETPGANLALLLDTQSATSAGKEEQTTLETAITAAASIATHLLEGGFHVQLYYYDTVTNADDRHAPVLRVRQLQGKSVESIGTILRALAEIVPVDDPGATLTRLAQNASPRIARGMGVVLLSSSRAEFASALQRAGENSSGAACRGLIFDADSYENADTGATKSRPRGITNIRRGKIRDTRLIYHGESLGAVLESQW